MRPARQKPVALSRAGPAESGVVRELASAFGVEDDMAGHAPFHEAFPPAPRLRFASGRAK